MKLQSPTLHYLRTGRQTRSIQEKLKGEVYKKTHPQLQMGFKYDAKEY